MTRAGSVVAARPADPRAGDGAIPIPALQDLHVFTIPFSLARAMVERHHYLRTLPAGTKLAFGVRTGASLAGVLTIGVGPINAHRLVAGTTRSEGATLTRLWLSDDLPPNSESRVIGVVLRALRRHTSLRFLLSYADPAHGHVGTIYQASGWLYTGLSQGTALIDLGDGQHHHSRSLGHKYGTHSIRYFRDHGVKATTIAQEPKHRYLYLLDRSLRDAITTPVLPYPKEAAS